MKMPAILPKLCVFFEDVPAKKCHQRRRRSTPHPLDGQRILENVNVSANMGTCYALLFGSLIAVGLVIIVAVNCSTRTTAPAFRATWIDLYNLFCSYSNGKVPHYRPNETWLEQFTRLCNQQFQDANVRWTARLGNLVATIVPKNWAKYFGFVVERSRSGWFDVVFKF
jgi:energy-converting hydrogenase Eha subunit F